MTTSAMGGVTVVDKPSVREIAQFLVSPYFNTNALVIKLFDWLCKFAPDFEEDSLCEEAAFKHLFPGEPFEEAKLRKLRSKLLKLLETYVHVKASMGNEFQQDLSLLRFFDKQNLLHDFDLHAAKMEQAHLHRPVMDGAFFLDLYQLEDAISRMKSGKSDDFVTDVNFQAASESLDLFYLTHKLMYASLMANRGKVLGGRFAFDYGLLPSLLPDAAQAMARHAAYADVLGLWLNAYHLLTSDDPSDIATHYHKLKNRVLELGSRLSVPDLSLLSVFLLNNIKKVFVDKERRYEEQFTWYKLLVDSHVYEQGAVLTPGMYKNIVTLALLVEETDWATQFMENNKQMLPVTDKSYDLCQAMVHFAKANYTAALEMLEGPNSVQQDNPYNLVIEKRIRLKTYFEMKDDFRFEALHDSFSTWLSRNQHIVARDYLMANRHFLTLVQELHKARFEKAKKRLRSIKAKVQANGELPEWKWLLKKVGEMDK